MRTLLAILFLAAHLTALGQGLVVNPYALAISGATYLIDQDFEGAGYDNGETWTEAGAGTFAIDEDYTGTVLDGSESLRFTMTAGSAQTFAAFTAQDEVWAYFLMRPVTIDTSFQKVIFSFNETGTIRCSVSVSTAGELIISLNTTATTVSTISAGTTYHVWVHYKKGTGANAIADVAFATTATKPTSGNGFAQVTNGNTTAQVNRIYLMRDAGTSTMEYLFDKVRVDNANIGDSPP